MQPDAHPLLTTDAEFDDIIDPPATVPPWGDIHDTASLAADERRRSSLGE